MITFGLFNGVVFLPVLLSYIGPEPYERIRASSDSIQMTDKTSEEQKSFIQSENNKENGIQIKLSTIADDDDDGVQRQSQQE